MMYATAGHTGWLSKEIIKNDAINYFMIRPKFPHSSIRELGRLI
jgi:hypothetical protein